MCLRQHIHCPPICTGWYKITIRTVMKYSSNIQVTIYRWRYFKDFIKFPVKYLNKSHLFFQTSFLLTKQMNYIKAELNESNLIKLNCFWRRFYFIKQLNAGWIVRCFNFQWWTQNVHRNKYSKKAWNKLKTINKYLRSSNYKYRLWIVENHETLSCDYLDSLNSIKNGKLYENWRKILSNFSSLKILGQSDRIIYYFV